ncbi:MAG: hypothetical protein JWP92_1851 [Caulobacter sp.]|nr:hypothetical protein [Caulobacter sp.]
MKYEPLKRRLDAGLDVDRLPMTFREIESLLGFPLPASARKHQAWWSNTRIGHSHAAAWLDPGWRTANVDLAAERVTFVKDAASGLAETPPARFQHRRADDGGTVVLDLGDLSAAARQLIDSHARRQGVGPAQAVAALLDETAIQRRQSMLDWFAQASPRLATDSVDLVREDRDAR